MSVVALSVAACDDNFRAPLAPTVIVPTTQPGPTVSGPQSIQGTITSVTAPDTIELGGQRVILGSALSIRSNSMPLSFSDLRIGAMAQAIGESDGSTLRASTVVVLSEVGTPVQLNGVIDGVTRGGDAFSFNIGSRRLRGDGNSQISGSSTSPSAFRDGQTVQVEGLQRTEYIYTTRVTVGPAGTSTSIRPPG